MAIIYPENCRRFTAGGMRQAMRSGFTNACGGILTGEQVLAILENPMDYFFCETEPAGIFMEKIEKAKRQLEEGAEAVRASSLKLTETAKEASKQMSDVTGKFRDGTERLGNAIDKLMKVAGRGDFAETVKLTESLVHSLERLAVLEEKGLLDKVMQAMRG